MTDIHKHMYGGRTEFNSRAVISSETNPHSDKLKYLIKGNALDGVAFLCGNLENIKASFPTYLSVLVKINRSLPLRNDSAIFKNLNNSFKLIPDDDFYPAYYALNDLMNPITFPYRHKDLSL